MGGVIDGVMTAPRLGAILGLSEARIRQLKAAEVLTAIDGKYDTRQAILDYTANLRQTAAGRSGIIGDLPEGKLDPAQEGARLKSLQSDMLEIQLAKARGEVMESGEIMAVWQEIISAAKNRIISLSSRLPTMLHGLTKSEIRIIDEECKEVLARLADDGEKSMEAVREEVIKEGAKTKYVK